MILLMLLELMVIQIILATLISSPRLNILLALQFHMVMNSSFIPLRQGKHSRLMIPFK
ncbi:hypothetical protein Hamer_G020594 [Homarus americanus]|uniref:Uncharacterized protein n=1 Tax=Homarus americanus TaxID=6706 RepID=A0A8J5JPS6_HOMAM|nr:hypothetical protein Hamer_G020594 [Homarus americanus]